MICMYLEPKSLYRIVVQGAIFMEQNMRFGLVLDLLIILKTNWAINNATFEGVFLCCHGQNIYTF